MIEKINNKNIIHQAVKILRSGGVVVIPTETAYGLACDATNEKAVMKIYKIKGRSFKKFLPLICSSVSQINKYFKLNKKELELLKKHKGLSVVSEVKNSVYLLKNQQTGAVRVSTNKVANTLAKQLGRPITATSANRAEAGNCYNISDVLKQLKEKAVDLILDAGKLQKRKPSTIVKVEGDKLKILRQGEIKC